MVWTFLFLRNVILHILCRVVHAFEVAAALDDIPIELKLWDADQSQMYLVVDRPTVEN